MTNASMRKNHITTLACHIGATPAKKFPANIILHTETLNNTMQAMMTAQHEMHKDISSKFLHMHSELETMKRDNELPRV